MSTATLDGINASLAEIAAHIDALRSTLGKPNPNSSMNPTVPARKNDRGLKGHARITAYRVAYTTQPTSKSLEKPKYHVKTVAGLNELDAEVTLRKHVRKTGRYLHTIIAMEPVS